MELIVMLDSESILKNWLKIVTLKIDDDYDEYYYSSEEEKDSDFEK